MAVNKIKYCSGNNASTTLSSSITDSATAAPLTSDTNFSAATGAGMVVIDEGTGSEEFAYATGKSGSSLTLPSGNRGLEGSSAVGHDSGASVKGILSATMWNDLVDGVATVVNVADGTIKKATGAEVTTGTEDAKIVTPKALKDAGIVAVTPYNGFRAILTPLSATFSATAYPQIVKNAGTYHQDFTLDFDKATNEYAYWSLVIPSGITINSATLYINFRMASVTTGTVTFGAYSKTDAEGESWDTAGNIDLFIEETVQGTAGLICQTSKALTTTGWSAGEVVQVVIYRDTAQDNADGDAKFMNAILVIS